MAVFGMLIEWLALRRMIGEPPFAVLMITIGLGFIFRAAAGAIWGNDPKSIAIPADRRRTEDRRSDRGLRESRGRQRHRRPVRRALPVLPVHPARHRHAGHVAEPARGLLYRHTVKRIFSIVWALSCAIAAAAGILVAPVSPH